MPFELRNIRIPLCEDAPTPLDVGASYKRRFLRLCNVFNEKVSPFHTWSLMMFSNWNILTNNMLYVIFTLVYSIRTFTNIVKIVLVMPSDFGILKHFTSFIYWISISRNKNDLETIKKYNTL